MSLIDLQFLIHAEEGKLKKELRSMDLMSFVRISLLFIDVWRERFDEISRAGALPRD